MTSLVVAEKIRKYTYSPGGCCAAEGRGKWGQVCSDNGHYANEMGVFWLVLGLFWVFVKAVFVRIMLGSI
jgi:hypothetical protein